MAELSVTFWKRSVRVLQVAFVLAIFLAVWLLAFNRGDDGAEPIVPDTQSQFSLDLSVEATVDHDVIYAVEQRARPYYRILALTPSTGDIETVFTLPEDAIIYGIDLSPDGSTLAVSYSPDFNLDGSGLYSLDIESQEMTEISPAVTTQYLVDPEWSDDGSSVFLTLVDRSGESDVLSILEASIADGGLVTVAEGGVGPQVDGADLYYLAVDDQNARKSVSVLRAGDVVEVAYSDFDLDHLLVGESDEAITVAVLDTETSSGLTIGSRADAHGNHDVPSTWWTVSGVAEADSLAAEPTIVYDAAISDGAIVYATREGLAFVSFDDGERIDLIKSRAIRFVAA